MAPITPREALVGGLCVWVVPLAQLLGARLAHRHWLDIEEN